MGDYTVHITLKSPIVTEFQSDTLFGHICWAIRYLRWKKGDRLAEVLASYKPGSEPPILISNGFPKGWLPKPVIPPVTQEVLDRIVKSDNRIGKSFIIKSIKKMPLILKEDFKKLQETGITPTSLFEILFERYKGGVPEETCERVSVQHNTVNRATGRVESGLYAQEETFVSPDKGEFEVYLKTDYFSEEDLQRIFDFIAKAGFGKDKSTGKGHFDFTIEQGIDLPQCAAPNAFMTLSSYIPKSGDPTDGYYTLLHKYGKLGGSFAAGDPEVYGNPFKKPLLMFAAGSTFRDPDVKTGKVYGSLLDEVHANSAIRHYALAFPLGIRLGETK